MARTAHPARSWLLAALAVPLAGCGEPAAAPVPAAPAFVEGVLPVPGDPVLALGQQVYRGDCTNCHELGKRGAPRIADAEAWEPRIAQGLDTLVTHALEGFSGPAGWEMPTRGGNEDLSDEEIAAAVRYLISHVP